jgi:hypothetical protein
LGLRSLLLLLVSLHPCSSSWVVLAAWGLSCCPLPAPPTLMLLFMVAACKLSLLLLVWSSY